MLSTLYTKSEIKRFEDGYKSTYDILIHRYTETRVTYRNLENPSVKIQSLYIICENIRNVQSIHDYNVYWAKRVIGLCRITKSDAYVLAYYRMNGWF